MRLRRITTLFALLALPLALWGIRRKQAKALVPQPRGLVLGMYTGDPDYLYEKELRRIQGTGATCVTLQAIYRMDTGHSNEVHRHPTSSPTEAALLENFRIARRLGLRVMFFPTINLRDEKENVTFWRGNIAPSDWDAWWASYTAFNLRLATLAQEGGVEWYSLGTEMASTHPFTERWCQLAKDVRQAFKGKLTYSVNFDSHDSFEFGSCLDVIGMNTYDPIAKYDEYPTTAQINDAWWWIVAKARTLRARFDRPVMITEVGYPSVAHAHVGPWDFRTGKPLDIPLQDHLLKGAFGVLRHWSDGDAVFYYLYGENLGDRNPDGSLKEPGGLEDRTYAVWGKPAEATLREYFARPIWEGHVPPKQEDIHAAVLETLKSHARKARDFEDYTEPRWVTAWKAAHPGDVLEVEKALKDEPPPAAKIPKGRER
jgi:hypothetical protein